MEAVNGRTSRERKEGIWKAMSAEKRMVEAAILTKASSGRLSVLLDGETL